MSSKPFFTRVWQICVVGALALSSILSGCTVEGTKGLGAVCLQHRECVAGLRCLPAVDNNYTCQPIYEGGLPMVPDVQRDQSTAETSDDSSTTDAGAME